MNNNKLIKTTSQKKNNKSILQKSKNFSKRFTSLVKDFNDPVKTLSVLNKNIVLILRFNYKNEAA